MPAMTSSGPRCSTTSVIGAPRLACGARVPMPKPFPESGDLGNFSGYRQGSPDYERAINIVHDAAFKAGARLCGPLAWRDRPDFTCFQAGSETAAIAAGVRAELGALANTQAKPEVGPFSETGRASAAAPAGPARGQQRVAPQ